jgi:hypothetical protein
MSATSRLIGRQPFNRAWHDLPRQQTLPDRAPFFFLLSSSWLSTGARKTPHKKLYFSQIFH